MKSPDQGNAAEPTTVVRKRVPVSRSGVLGGVVPALVLILVAVFALRLASARGNGDTQGLFINVGLLAGALAILYGVSALWGTGTLRRNRQLKQLFPHVLVLGGVRSRTMADAVKRVRGDKSLTLPIGLSMTITSRGVEIWAGWAETRSLLQLPWSAIQHVTATNLAELGRSSRGLAIGALTPSGIVEVEMIITGRGLAGLFPETKSHLEDVASKAEAFRRAAVG